MIIVVRLAAPLPREAVRDGREFVCWECGYEAHADVNAAINIAQR